MAKVPHSRPRIEPDDADRLLLNLATGVLAAFFFNPDNEERFLAEFPSRRSQAAPAPLAEAIEEHESGTLSWRIDVLGQRNGFRLIMKHRVFSATVEGVWQFQRETLRDGRVTQRLGGARRIVDTATVLLEAMSESDPTEEEIIDMIAALGDEQEMPMIGDDPEQPPPATAMERDRMRALIGQVARTSDDEMRMEDRSWLETTPQTLPVLTDLLVEAMLAQPRDDRRVATSLSLLTLQLEFVRYRLDRGWDWASAMLNDYQQRLIELGRGETLQQTDWFTMASALSQARVPVSDDVQVALADAGLSGALPAAPPEELQAALRTLSNELAAMVGSPFDVIEALNAAGAVMPGALRAFMATELALSAHAVMREAAPLMLLDAEPSVRRAAAAALAQTAASVSSDSLRRAITMRNWIPPADRKELDHAIYKARAGGIPIGIWPPTGRAAGATGDIAFHATMVDGSGAQSILATSRGTRKGLLAGILLKHGIGVQDAWLDPEMSRANINGILRDLKGQVPSDEVDKSYVDAAVQHAIGTGLTHGAVPGDKLLAIAERVGAGEWKDRQLDVAAEAERMFGGLLVAQRRPAAVREALRRGAVWMVSQPIAASWFEDSKGVRQVLAKLPRKDIAGATRLVLSEILPASRMAWAERFLLMAMWCQAANGKAHRAWAGDFVVLTQALTGTAPLDTIPIMNSIAAQTVRAARSSGW